MKSILKKIITIILEIEARAVLKKYHPKIIAVTGSVGKTSTKDAIYTVLAYAGRGSSSTRYVRKSEKSFNSEIGVPLTILGCENGWSDPFLWLNNIFHGLELIFFKTDYPDCLVLEVGADHPGDIENLARWLRPDIVVVTKISAVPVHIEFFSSRDDLLKEKSYLARALKKGGTLVLSEDDEDVKNISKKMPEGIASKILTFGIRHSATVNASHDSIIYEEKEGMKIPVGISFKLNFAGNSVPIFVKGVLGTHHVYPLLAATAVGLSRGIILTDIIEALRKNVAPRGRMNILNGIHRSLIIDDTYNSSPDALREALVTLGKVETTGKKIAVLGDMMELGKFSIEEHKKAGELARQVASVVVTVGQRSRVMGGASASFNTSSEAAEYVRGIVEKGDIVLIKGSQSVRMERVAKSLILEQDKASELLVRQEPEWLAR